MLKQPSRHDQLIAAGWRYDAAQDRYAAPDSPSDGTETWHNLAAAWQAFQASGQPAQTTPPATTRARDPREQEPQ